MQRQTSSSEKQPAQKFAGFFDAPDPALEAAAIRIQAAERGRQSRKRHQQQESVEVISTAVPMAVSENQKGQEPHVDSFFSVESVEEPPIKDSFFSVEEASTKEDWLGNTERVVGEAVPGQSSNVLGPDLEATAKEPSSMIQDSPAIKEEKVRVHAEVLDPFGEAQPADDGSPFKMEPLIFDHPKSPEEERQSPEERRNQGDDVPVATMDWLPEESIIAVPQRLQLPKVKKSPRQKAERIGPIIPKPKAQVKDSSAWFFDSSYARLHFFLHGWKDVTQIFSNLVTNMRTSKVLMGHPSSNQG